MFSPFSGDLSDLSDNDIQEKIKQLSTRYLTAQRLGKNEMLTQLQTFITIYREELKLRSAKNKLDDNNDLDDLINVD